MFVYQKYLTVIRFICHKCVTRQVNVIRFQLGAKHLISIDIRVA